jgi:RNA polymerase sigma-70 factor, ECF subfamily
MIARIDWPAIAAQAATEATGAGTAGELDAARLAAHLVGLGLDAVPAHLGDVVLGFAATSGDPLAQAEVHRQLVRAARMTLPAAGYAEHVVDDTIGELSLTLLGTESPLRTYRGHASLVGWLRTLVARTALRLVEACRREASAPESDGDLVEHVAATDLTRDLYRVELRTAVRRAFATAITRVSYFERELLADFLARGRGLDDIAKAHDVHRATAARWLARARAALDRELRSELHRDLVASDSEVASILDSVRSSIELSVERLLKP